MNSSYTGRKSKLILTAHTEPKTERTESNRLVCCTDVESCIHYTQKVILDILVGIIIKNGDPNTIISKLKYTRASVFVYAVKRFL